jgi:hypothetical protein
MGKSIFFRIVMVFIIIAAIAGLGVFAYQAGLANGAAQVAVTNGAPGAVVQAPYMMPYWGGPFGFHHFGFFGIFGLLIPIFFFLIIFSAIRGLFWGRHYGMHGWHHGRMDMRHGDWDKEGTDVPPFFEEMHRRMHERDREAGKPEDKKE